MLIPFRYKTKMANRQDSSWADWRLPRMATPPNSPHALRPKRFALELPVEFRSHESEKWWQGTTENISANGVLFRTRETVLPLTPLDLIFELPDSVTGDGRIQLLCTGYVVRCVEPSPPAGHAEVAATFHTYRLAHRKAGPSTMSADWQDSPELPNIGKLFHRLNTLLFMISGGSELLVLDAGNESKVQYLAAQMHKAAEEAAGLIRSLARLYPRDIAGT